MKVVLANKFYYLKGGAEKYLFDLAVLLNAHGNEVVPFAMADVRNVPTSWNKYFVSNVQTERVSFSWEGLRTAGRILYSFEAKKKFARLLDETAPTVVHLQNIYHQISPSIIPEAVKRNIPVVMTAHDYKMIAPNYALFHDGKICERTKPQEYWEVADHRCIKGSYIAGLLEAAEMTLHRSLGLYDGVQKIIAPSSFMASKLEEYGIAKERIVHVPHFIDATAWAPQYGGSYALFVGRLSPEKGVDVLVRAAAKAKSIPVRIVGTGPDEARLRALASELAADNVVFVGFKEGAELIQEYAGSRYVVVPSIWLEVAGLIALEAYAAGKPVIASKLGGLAEMVKDGETGVRVVAGDDSALAAAMLVLWSDPTLCETFGRKGRTWVESSWTPEAHYQKIMEVYSSVIPA
jgi:glycosyltransferase involved in cell wall biosynthesis